MNSFENNPGANPSEDSQPVNPPYPQQNIQNGQQSSQNSCQGCQGGPSSQQQPPRSPYENSPYVNSPYANSPYMNNQQPPHQDAWGNPTYPPKPPKEKKHKKHSPWGRRILAGVLVAALVAAGCGITAASVNSHWKSVNDKNQQSLQAEITELKKQISDTSRLAANGGSAASTGLMTPSQVYAKNVSSVVAISSTMGEHMGQVAKGTGSGFILSPDGYVATNCHVVDGAVSISVITGDNTSYEAKLLGKDRTNDVAILKIDAQGLPAVTLGSSNDLLIGDMVVAIGNPLGELTATQTVGYVCGKDRTVTTGGAAINMLQTDAAINPGNSGGPLFNMKGEVIGITTAKYSGTTGSGASIEGIGFAIPIDDVLDIMRDLAEKGYVTGPYLGVSVRDVDPQIASVYNIPLGAYVVEVVEDASADRAGIQPKDIITKLGDHEIQNSNDLIRALRHFKVGESVTVTLNRAGAEKTVTMELDEKPQQQATPTEAEAPQPDSNSSAPSDEDMEKIYEYIDRIFGDIFGVPRR